MIILLLMMNNYIDCFKLNQKLSEQERIDWLRLIKTSSIGGIKGLSYLTKKFGDAKTIIQEFRNTKFNFISNNIELCSEEIIQNELNKLQKIGAKAILFLEEAYPQLLLQINGGYPLALFVKGNINLLYENNLIAIVGSRNASHNSCKFAERLTAELTQEHNIKIVSGLARGIDVHAHKGAGIQNTIAVIGSGLDVVYPREHHKIHQQIADDGLLISEYFIGVKPKPNHFPQRNRIIAGITKATIVIEAMRYSGSLITARYCLEYNRDLFAVPGSPLDLRTEGTNELIKQGAFPLTEAEDVINNVCLNKVIKHNETTNLLNIDTVNNVLPLNQKQNNSYKKEINNKDSYNEIKEKILNLLSYEAILIDDIIQTTGEEVKTIRALLLRMELEGIIVREAGDRVCLAIEYKAKTK